MCVAILAFFWYVIVTDVTPCVCRLSPLISLFFLFYMWQWLYHCMHCDKVQFKAKTNQNNNDITKHIVYQHMQHKYCILCLYLWFSHYIHHTFIYILSTQCICIYNMIRWCWFLKQITDDCISCDLPMKYRLIYMQWMHNTFAKW